MTMQADKQRRATLTVLMVERLLLVLDELFRQPQLTSFRGRLPREQADAWLPVRVTAGLVLASTVPFVRVPLSELPSIVRAIDDCATLCTRSLQIEWLWSMTMTYSLAAVGFILGPLLVESAYRLLKSRSWRVESPRWVTALSIGATGAMVLTFVASVGASTEGGRFRTIDYPSMVARYQVAAVARDLPPQTVALAIFAMQGRSAPRDLPGERCLLDKFSAVLPQDRPRLIADLYEVIGANLRWNNRGTFRSANRLCSGA
jgi:hypothetical protein